MMAFNWWNSIESSWLFKTNLLQTVSNPNDFFLSPSLCLCSFSLQSYVKEMKSSHIYFKQGYSLLSLSTRGRGRTSRDREAVLCTQLSNTSCLLTQVHKAFGRRLTKEGFSPHKFNLVPVCTLSLHVCLSVRWDSFNLGFKFSFGSLNKVFQVNSCQRINRKEGRRDFSKPFFVEGMLGAFHFSFHTHGTGSSLRRTCYSVHQTYTEYKILFFHIWMKNTLLY